MRHRTSLFTILSLLTVAASNAIAELSSHGSHNESHAAHTHGTAELTMAWDGKTLEAEVISPAANLVGFEHKARSTEEQQAVLKAEKLLKSPQHLFSFQNTKCKLLSSAVDMSGVKSEAKESHKDESSEHHHDHHEEKNHNAKHDDHSEITANYQFECDADKNPISVSVVLFESFKAIEKIDAMWVTETEQAAKTLDKEKRTITLK